MTGGYSNILAVRLENVGQSSRWYPGAGLYRHVNLLVSNPVSVDVWGTFITTPLVTEQVAKIQLKTRIHKPEAAKELSLSTEIFDPRGRSLFVQKETLLIAGDSTKIMPLNIRSSGRRKVRLYTSLCTLLRWNKHRYNTPPALAFAASVLTLRVAFN